MKMKTKQNTTKTKGGLVVLHRSLTRDSNKHLWCQFSRCSPSPPSRKLSLGIVYILFEIYFHFIWRILFSRGGWLFSPSLLLELMQAKRPKLGSDQSSLVWQSPLLLQPFPGTCCPLLSPPSIDLSPLCCQLPILQPNLPEIPKTGMGDGLRDVSEPKQCFSSMNCLPCCAFPFCAIQVWLCESHFDLPGIFSPINHLQGRHFVPIFSALSGWLFAGPSWIFAARFLTCSFPSANYQELFPFSVSPFKVASPFII